MNQPYGNIIVVFEMMTYQLCQMLNTKNVFRRFLSNIKFLKPLGLYLLIPLIQSKIQEGILLYHWEKI